MSTGIQGAGGGETQAFPRGDEESSSEKFENGVEDDGGGDSELGSGDKSNGENDSLSEGEDFSDSPSRDSQESGEEEDLLPPTDDFQVFAGNLKNVISWSGVEGATYYNIYRSTSQSDWQMISSTTATSFEDEIDLDSLGYYYYRVAAVGEDGSEGEFSEICSNSEVNMSGLFSPAFSSTLISANGEVFFTVPTSSLESTQEIMVREKDAMRFPVGVINPATSLYVFSPSGTVFSSSNPAILSLKYNIYLPSEEIKEKIERYFLSLYYQDEEGNYQKIASRVDWENDRIEGDITHFSGYQGFWQQPHGNYGDSTDLCGVCHELHGSDYKDINICYSCHGNSSGSYTTSVLVDAPGAPSNYFSPNIQAQFSQCEDQLFDPNTMSRHELATGEVLGLLCTTCHTPHKDPSGYTDLLAVRPTYTLYNIRLYSYSTDPLGNDLCYACHGTSPSQYLITPTSSGGLGLINYYSESGGDHESYFEGSKHSTNIGIPSATYRDATGTVSSQIKCLACHEHHGSTVNTRNIRDAIYVTVTVGTGTINYISTTSISNDTSLCFACHSTSSYGFSEEWQNAITSGVYPETGTFPGEAAWKSSPHTSSLAAWPGSSLSGGDCKNCHNPHNTSNPYDMLRTDGIYYATQSVTFNRTTFNFCFECHSPEGPAVHDIESKYNDLSAVERGHITKSRGATDTIGDTGDFQLPCYDCHDVHGNTSGNQKLLAPFRVTNYDGSASKVREFCTSCHIFADDLTTHRTIEGISCEDSGSVLHLPSAVAEHASTGSQSCLSCHGDVHRPSSTGESGGGTDCSGCHNSIYTAMSTAGGYHHLMDNASATYSSGISTMNCLSCHVDHDIFRPDLNPSGERAKNLRYDNTDTNVTTLSARNKDFISSETNGGICVSCHQSELNKETYTPTLGVTTVGPIAKTDYASSSHNYEATSTFSSDSSTFYANCLKCHTKEEANSYQSSTNKFALHNSNLPRLLLASEESACYICHSISGGGGDPRSDNFDDGTVDSKWIGLDISASPSGSESESTNPGKMTVRAGGGNNGLRDGVNQDNFRFTYQSTSTPTQFTIEVKIESLGNQTGRDAAGIMVRDGTANNARMFFVGYSRDRGRITTYWRTNAGQNSNRLDGTINTFPCWVKIKVNGNTYTAYESSNGSSWNQITSQNITMSQKLFGLATSVGNVNNRLTTAIYDDFVFTEVGVGGPDYYGVVTMTANSKAIDTQFNKTYKHPVTTSGTHTSYYHEYQNATAGWMTASSGRRHAECADCHNPHVAASGTHTLGSNNAGNAIKGVWGVQVSYGGTPWTSPTFTKVQSITKEYELCFKCHSSWAWKDDPPDATDPGSYNYKQTDISREFNPNNLSYHPIIAPGKNQPNPSLNQTNWEGGYGISGSWTRTGMSGVANDANYVGLTNTFVPPYGASSLLTCSDCHTNDDPSGPQGPHGSTQKWFLKKVDTGITYTRKDGTVVSYGATGGNVNLNLGTNDPNNFCLNCHRADVYGRNQSNGVAVAQNLSRFDHESGLSAGRCNDGTKNVYQISCMLCHGGDALGNSDPPNSSTNFLGGVHGSNLTATFKGANSVGERLLNGASWEGHSRGSTTIEATCFTKDVRDAELTNCDAHGGGREASTVNNYNY